uniref:Integrase core domain containing protein n=1 Tax=Solanum tuberosum TaxID=4113 RepID=M1DK40_SOLTU
MVREFYASYTATVQNFMLPRVKPLAQPPLQATLVRGLLLAYQRPSSAVLFTTQYKLCRLIQQSLEVDFSRIIIAEIHDRVFYKTTTMPFLCLIFRLCREATIPLWPFDRLVEVFKTVDMGLIKDDANHTAPRKGHTARTPRAPTPLGSVLIPIARVQKIETRMATLLHYMRPWMQRSLEESEVHMEKMMDEKIKAVHKWIEAFELRELQRPQTRPTIDVTTFQKKLARLRAYVNALSANAEVVLEPTPEVADDMVLSSLFGYEMPTLDPPCSDGKRIRLSENTKDINDSRQTKRRERQE